MKDLIVFLIVFCFILYLTKIILKKYANIQTKISKNNNIKVLESKSLGINHSLHIIKVGNSFHLIGTTKENISYCSRLDKEDIGGNLNENEKQEK